MPSSPLFPLTHSQPERTSPWVSIGSTFSNPAIKSEDFDSGPDRWDKQKKLEDKLSQEQAYEKWVYLVSNWTLDSLLKDRAQLLVEKKEEPKKDEKPAAADASKKEGLPAPPVAPEPDAKK